MAEHAGPAIPLPAHGFASLDALEDVPGGELVRTPAAEVVTRAGLLLVSAAAQKLGLTEQGTPEPDIPQARVLISALAGLLSATENDLGDRRAALVDGLHTLQAAYRETAARPDPAGQGPGEALGV